MWVIRRLKNLGCEKSELLNVLRQQVLSACEQAVPHWGPMITIQESHMIERILKTGLHIIYGEDYKTFKHALKLSNMKSLADRRKDLIFKFAKKCMSSEKYQNWFCNYEIPENGAETRTRQTKPLIKPVVTRTDRYARTALPLMTKLVGWHPPLIYSPPRIV